MVARVRMSAVAAAPPLMARWAWQMRSQVVLKVDKHLFSADVELVI